MDTITQLSFNSKAQNAPRNAEWGTFKDSLRAPVHRWFTYPAGFSYKAVVHSIRRFDLTVGQTIYDPFMGSGTTNVVAKTLGIHSVGVEAHPFVFKIAQAKLCWGIDQTQVHSFSNYSGYPSEVQGMKGLPVKAS